MINTHPNLVLLQWAHRLGMTRFALGQIDEKSPRVQHNARSRSEPPHNVLVVCESGRGRAGTASKSVAEAAVALGVIAGVATIDDVATADVEATDALIAGCWMPGRAPFGDGPMRRMVAWIESLPPLDGKPVGVFCTYRFFPHTFADMATRTAETERGLADCLERKGAVLVAKKAIHFGSVDTDAAELLRKVLEHAA